MKKIILAIFFLFINIAETFAVTEPVRVNINEAVNIAVKNNLDIRASRLNKEIEKNNIKSANRLQNPEAGVFYNLGKAGKGNPQQIGISQTVEIGKRKARKQYANAVYELTSRQVEYTEFDLKMDVREAYTNLLAKKSVLNTMKQQELFLNKMVEKTKSKYKSGKVDETDILQASLLLNQIIMEVNSALYDVKTAVYDFNKVINSPEEFYDTKEDKFTKDYMPLVTPDANFKMPDFDVIADKAIDNRFDIKIALENIEVAKKNLNLILKQKIPDLEVSGGYAYQNPGQSEDSTFKHGAYVAANIVNIPLFYRFNPEIKSAELKLEQANLNYESVKNKALNDLRKTYEKFLLAQMHLRSYNDKLLKNSADLINASRKNYLEDKIDLTTLISMEESYRMITVAHTYAIADYFNAWNAFIREVNNDDFNIDDI